MTTVEMEDIISKFTSLTEKPVKYLTVQKELKEDIKNLVKSMYDFTKSQEKSAKSKNGALSEMIVNDFDEEQIWQQIEMQNSERWDQMVWDVANCVSNKNLLFPVYVNVDQESDLGKKIVKSYDEHTSNNRTKRQKPKKKTMALKSPNTTKISVVDDEFFNLQEMQKFLVMEEKAEVNAVKKKKDDSDEESIDMFEDVDDDEDGDGEGGDDKDAMYYDFFAGECSKSENDDENEEEESDETSEKDESEVEGSIDDENDNMEEDNENDSTSEKDKNEMNGEEEEAPEDSIKNKKKDKKVRFATDESIESEASDNEIETPGQNNNIDDTKKSEFELRQQRLKEQISRLENKKLTEAPWQLKGEVDAKIRPKNSLLEEIVDFDLTTRPAPIITEQTTLTLEDIIRQRVKDKAWDDVIRKEKPVDDQLAFRKPEILDHSKSKLSLAQVYEAEYLKQKQSLTGADEDEKEPESHIEIREAMSKLFSKLDTLSHYHYTPKAPQAEVKIISNTPAISMEEVAPIATSEAALLAPEEVKKKQRGDLLSKEERTQTDKNRERRKKKKLQQKKGKVMKVTEHKNTTKGVESTDKALKTSKAFFQQLNDDTTSQIKSKTNRNVKNKGQ